MGFLKDASVDFIVGRAGACRFYKITPQKRRSLLEIGEDYVGWCNTIAIRLNAFPLQPVNKDLPGSQPIPLWKPPPFGSDHAAAP